MAFKYCIVPKCPNNSITSPNKIFISLPKDADMRKQWQKAMHRKKLLSSRCTRYCCEDHFNLEEDMQNYMYFKIMKNVKIKMKPGVVPHIFHCQDNKRETTFVKTEETLTDEVKNSLQITIKQEMSDNIFEQGTDHDMENRQETVYVKQEMPSIDLQNSPLEIITKEDVPEMIYTKEEPSSNEDDKFLLQSTIKKEEFDAFEQDQDLPDNHFELVNLEALKFESELPRINETDKCIQVDIDIKPESESKGVQVDFQCNCENEILILPTRKRKRGGSVLVQPVGEKKYRKSKRKVKTSV